MIRGLRLSLTGPSDFLVRHEAHSYGKECCQGANKWVVVINGVKLGFGSVLGLSSSASPARIAVTGRQRTIRGGAAIGDARSHGCIISMCKRTLVSDASRSAEHEDFQRLFSSSNRPFSSSPVSLDAHIPNCQKLSGRSGRVFRNSFQRSAFKKFNPCNPTKKPWYLLSENFDGASQP